MKLWFLRFSDASVTSPMVRRAKLAPVLFRAIPVKNCSLQLSISKIRELVAEHYPDPANSAASRSQLAGALTRFLINVQVGDIVAICLNRGSNLLFGEILEGGLVEFPNIENSKARPVRWLTDKETLEITSKKLPTGVRQYSGTICFWMELDLPDADEKKKLAFYSPLPVPSATTPQKQIKFIRVGADFGCGGRLSRLLPGNYYHFIPIPQHNDPEFCRFTYGDGYGPMKYFSLLTLRRDDILVFYAGFDTEPGNVPTQRVVGIFAYFVVRDVYIFDRNPGKQLALQTATMPRSTDLLKLFKAKASSNDFQAMMAYCGNYNAHALVETVAAPELIICGSLKLSRLLQKVEILAPATNGKYILSSASAAHWGLKAGADLTRCSVRTVNPSQVNIVSSRLASLP